MSDIFKLLEREEGWSSQPYYCTENYPTIGFGFRIGPKDAPLKLYRLHISKALGVAWLAELVQETMDDMQRYPEIVAALASCNDARKAVLISMAYQMGADGLAKFDNTLKAVAEQRWGDAQAGMTASKWARQTPNRANRHAIQMLRGLWHPEYK